MLDLSQLKNFNARATVQYPHDVSAIMDAIGDIIINDYVKLYDVINDESKVYISLNISNYERNF